MTWKVGNWKVKEKYMEIGEFTSELLDQFYRIAATPLMVV